MKPLSFPGGSNGKESACNARNPGSISGLGRYPGGGHGNPLQYFCLKNPVDRGACGGYSPHGRKELDVTKQLTIPLLRSIENGVCVYVCLTLCCSLVCSPPGSSVHGISQARILEWVVFLAHNKYCINTIFHLVFFNFFTCR